MTPIEVAKAAEGQVEHHFTIIFRQKKGEPPNIEFVPRSKGGNLTPRDCIVLCAEAIKWLIGQEIALEREAAGAERRVDLWVPPRIQRPA